MKPILFAFLAQITETDITNLPRVKAGHDTVQSALRIAFGIGGGLSLLIVTIGGLKYVLSRGNPQETAKAKDTIMYALIGLVVMILAFGIVTFVLNRV